MRFVNTLSSKLEKILDRTVYPATSENIRKNVELARIFSGVFSFLRYFDTYNQSIIVPNPFDGWLIFASILSLMLAFGLFTPLVVIVSILSIHVYSAYMWNLNSLVSIILLWFLFFMGAGKTISLDFYLKERFSWFYNKLYFFAVKQTERNLAIVRLAVIAMYWSLTFSAMAFHFRDWLWIKGDILNLMMVTPYLSEWYFLFDYFQHNMPILYDIFCKVGIYVQGAWELLLFPLMFFSWGYLFSNFQGFAFFIISLVGINVSFLPWQELFLWFAIFHYPFFLKNKKTKNLYFDDRCNLCQRTISVIKFCDFFNSLNYVGLSSVNDKRIKEGEEDLNFILEIDGNVYRRFESYYALFKTTYPFYLFFPIFFIGKITGIGELIYSYVEKRRRKIFGMCELTYPEAKEEILENKFGNKLLACFSLFVIFLSFVQAGFQSHVNLVEGSQAERYRRKLHNEFRVFGMDQVNVFNKEDMGMGDSLIIIAEVSDSGVIKRVVPFMDQYGGRLDYLRNDFLYFNMSLLWQRTPKSRKYFVGENNENDVNSHGKNIAKKVIDLDICLREEFEPKRYIVGFFERKMIELERGYKWGETTYYSHIVEERSSAEMANLKNDPRCKRAFRMNFGHIFSNERSEKTLDFLREHALHFKTL